MKIKAFAIAQGVSYDRMYRAARWSLAELGRTIGKRGRYGGDDLKPDEMELCLQYLSEHKKSAEHIYTDVERYHAQRQLWLETYHRELVTERVESARAGDLLAVYGCLALAETEEMLEMKVYSERLGDLALELCYLVGVDLIGNTNLWQGFTFYLIDKGYESPGWDVI